MNSPLTPPDASPLPRGPAPDAHIHLASPPKPQQMGPTNPTVFSRLSNSTPYLSAYSRPLQVLTLRPPSLRTIRGRTATAKNSVARLWIGSHDPKQMPRLMTHMHIYCTRLPYTITHGQQAHREKTMVLIQLQREKQ